MDPTTTPQQTIDWCEAQVNSVKDDDLKPTYAHWLAPTAATHSLIQSVKASLDLRTIKTKDLYLR